MAIALATPSTPVQMELDLRLSDADEAFIEGFKRGHGLSRANGSGSTTAPTVDEIFSALHKYQKSPK